MIKLLKWFQGYLLVYIKGYSPERFINLCSSKNILIWNLRKSENGYLFYISLKGYRKLKPIVRKTRTIPFIKGRYGLPFIMYRYRKRKVFFFGIVICCALIYSMSLFIWDISIQGEYTHTAESMLKFLKTKQVYSGSLKKNIKCSEIEEEIRSQYNDIGWVSAEIKGTRLFIKITETNMPEKYENIKDPSHIVASSDGIVVSIITRKGTPKVQKGAIVKKGDILVSGVLDIILDGNEIIRKEPVAADADIVLKTVYEYEDEFPLDYIEKQYTNKKKSGYAISILNKKLFLYNPLKKYSKYDIIEVEHNLRLGENFYLPVKFHEKIYKEYKEIKNKYNKTQANDMAVEKLDLYIKKLEENGIQLIENNVVITVTDKVLKAGGKLVMEAPAVEYKPVEDGEWRSNITDEHNGENN